MIPGLGRSAGEGIVHPLQYPWASHVAQLVKNLPAMQETWVLSLGWEDPLKKEMATLSLFCLFCLIVGRKRNESPCEKANGGKIPAIDNGF